MSTKLKRDWTSPVDRLLNKQRAWKQGKKVMLTVENPDKTATNMKMIRVDASTIWGDPRKEFKQARRDTSEE